MIERVFGVALFGLSRGIHTLEGVAERIARTPSSLPFLESAPPETPASGLPLEPVDAVTPDFIGDTVSLLLAQRYIEFQLGVVRTADEVLKETVNLKG